MAAGRLISRQTGRDERIKTNAAARAPHGSMVAQGAHCGAAHPKKRGRPAVDGARPAAGEIAGGRSWRDEPTAGSGVVVNKGFQKWLSSSGQTPLIGQRRLA